MSGSYSTYELPHQHPDISAYAKVYSELRLRGLKQSPASFSSTYEEELNLPEAQKLARFTNSKRHVIVAAADAGEQALYSREWAGSVTLLGPFTWEEYMAPLTSRNSQLSMPKEKTLLEGPDAHNTANGQTSYWHMTALFVDENYRGQGIAKKLCEASFVSMQQQKPHETNELRIIVKAGNFGVVKMYEKLGFITSFTWKASLAEAVIASGEPKIDAETLAANPKYGRREGLIMIKRI